MKKTGGSVAAFIAEVAPTKRQRDAHALVDMMRDLRYTEARRHVREEVPFYTGRRVTLDEIPEILQ